MKTASTPNRILEPGKRQELGTVKLDQIKTLIDKIRKLLENYRDKYLKDSVTFPGGCVFVTLSVELDDQRPELAGELKKGFEGLKSMINRLLDEGKNPDN